MLQFQRDSLSLPLLALNKSSHKEALKMFKNIQRIMTDKPRPKGSAASDDIHYILERGIQQPELRDESYLQICKQVTKNPNPESTFKGWELLAVICVTYPPSKSFEEHIRRFIKGNAGSKDNRVRVLSAHCLLKMDRMCKAGPRGKVLTNAEIERARIAAFKPSPFGETLDFIMDMQKERLIGIPVPKILVFLTIQILKLNGLGTEGIFRVPGDAEAVTELVS